MSQTQEQPAPMNPAEAYERSLVTRVFRPLAREVLSVARPGEGDRVLDVASGTGICLREVADITGGSCYLVGFDLNPAMIAVGRQTAEEAGVQIDWHQGNAVDLPFEDGSFDWVFCQQGLQFFPDRPTALREMWRVLGDGGHAVISVWQSIDRHPYPDAIDQAGVELVGDHLLRTPNGPFSLGDPDELNALLDQAGFRDIQVKPASFDSTWDDPMGALRMDIAGAFAAVASLQQISDAERANLLDGLVERLKPTVDQYVQDGVLVNPWHANVAVARK